MKISVYRLAEWSFLCLKLHTKEEVTDRKSIIRIPTDYAENPKTLVIAPTG